MLTHKWRNSARRILRTRQKPYTIGIGTEFHHRIADFLWFWTKTMHTTITNEAVQQNIVCCTASSHDGVRNLVTKQSIRVGQTTII
jgi:hypothetical protein